MTAIRGKKKNCNTLTYIEGGNYLRKIEVYELTRSEEISNVPPVINGGIILILDSQTRTVYEKDIYGNISVSEYLNQFTSAPVEPTKDTITFSVGDDSHTFSNDLTGSWAAIIHLFRHKSNDEYRLENIENIFNSMMLPEDQKIKYNPDVPGIYTDEWKDAF